MKRAWVTVEPWQNRIVGQIERVSDIESWEIFCVNNGWVIPVDFDDTTIDEKFLVASFINDEWVISENTTLKNEIEANNLENKKSKWEDDCIAGGIKVKGKFNRLLSKYEYGDTEQEFFMTDTDFQFVDYLLNHGALNKTIGLLTMKDPVSYYTENFKNDFIAIVQAISDEIGNEPV